MTWFKNQNSENIYRSILSFLASSALSLGFNHYYRLEVPIFIILICNAIMAVVLEILNYAKNKFLTYSIILAGALLAFVVGRVFHIAYTSQLKMLYQSFWQYIEDGEDIQMKYSVVLVLLAVLFTAVFCYWIGFNLKVKGIVCVLLTGVFISFAMNEIELDRLTLSFYYLYAGSTAVEFFHSCFNQNKEGEYRNTAAFLFPVVILYVLFMVILPSDEKPIEWKGIKKAAAGVVSLVEEISYRFRTADADEMYSLKSIGFEEGETNLGGDIRESQQTIFQVEQRGVQHEPIYIVGAVKDTYTGSKWEWNNTQSDGAEDYNIDLYEKLYYLYLSELPSSEQSEMFHQVDLTEIYDGFRTKSIFYPVNTRRIEFWGEHERTEYDRGNLLFDQVEKRYTRYTAYMVEWNTEHPILLDYLRSQDRLVVQDKKISQDLWNATNNSTLFQEGKQIVPLNKNYFFQVLPELLDKRQVLIEENNTALPAQLPQRVYELADRLTKDYDNDYDKLNAIRDYLLQFQYSMSPGPHAADQDFIDQFLFQGQQGYCTYFATAMAVLSRCIGVPSRYVEGFRIHPKLDGEQGNYPVTSASGHAWAEVYLEGFGWIIMEATPGYRSSEAAASWFRAGSEEALGQIPEGSIAAPERPEIVSALPQEPSGEEKHPAFFIVPILIVFLFIVVLFSFFLYKNKSRLKRYKDADIRERICLDCAEIIFYLSALKYRLKTGDTISTMMKAIKEFENESGIDFTECFQIFMKARYSYLMLEDEEGIIVAAAKNKMINYLNHKNKWMWIKRIRWVIQG